MTTDFRTPLGRVRGLGSAKTGVSHWWMQRVTAVALVPLVLWFVCGIVSHTNKPLYDAVAWMQQIQVAVPMVLFLLMAFYHAALGLQVVIEDYIHAACVRTAAIIFVQLGCVACAVTGVISVLSIYLQA